MAEQYLPLYRKYRPQEFGDLVGQDNLVKAFTNAINTGKIAHAYLFCGPRGTGKTSSARILAKSLNCQNGPTLTPCGKCPACLDILNGNMIDVIEMDAASNRSVEDAQSIIDKIHYAPVNGRYKIFIIDEVHMISKTAFNALLKTLEEPPENVIFILATTEPQKVLETIISRCQRFDFRRITVEDIVKRLKFVSEKENIKIDDNALFAIAKNSQGGMRDALALLDQISILDVENEITVDKVNEMVGKIDTEVLVKLAQAVFENSVENSIKIINELYSKGNEPLQIIENTIQFFRNLSVVKTCKDSNYAASLTLLSPDITDLLQKEFETVSVGETAKIIERLTHYYKEIKYTNNRYLWLELCFIDLASGSEKIQKETTKISTVEIKPLQAEKTVKTEVNPPKTEDIIKDIESPANPKDSEKESSQPVNTESITKTPKTQDSVGDWKNLLNYIDSPPSRSFFNTFAKPVELGKSKIIVTFKDENFAKRAQEPSKYEALKKAGLKFYNSPFIDVEIRVGSAPQRPVKTQETEKQNDTPLSEKKTVTIPEKIADNKKSEPENEPEIPDSQEAEASIPEVTKISYEYNKYTDQVKMVKELFDAKVFD